METFFQKVSNLKKKKLKNPKRLLDEVDVSNKDCHIFGQLNGFVLKFRILAGEIIVLITL